MFHKTKIIQIQHIVKKAKQRHSKITNHNKTKVFQTGP